MKLEDILKNYTSEPKVVETFLSIKDRYNISGLTVENISFALVSIILEVNKLKKLNHVDRKQLTITIINHLVEEICPGDDTVLETILKQMIPNLYDQIQDMKNPLKCCCF